MLLAMIDPGRGCEPGTSGLMANKLHPAAAGHDPASADALEPGLGARLRQPRRPLSRRGANNQIQVINHPRLDDPARPEDVLHVGESIF
jgi:hypothetical protein